MPTVAIVAIAASVGLFAYSALDLFFGKDRRVKRRLSGLSSYEDASLREVEPLVKPFEERVTRPVLGSFVSAANWFAPRGYRARAKRRLRLAGNPRGLSAERFFAEKVWAWVAGWAAIVLADIIVGGPSPGGVLGGAVAALAFFFLPDLLLLSKRQARQKAIRRALPDMLDMLTISVEAGLGFDAAVAKVVAANKGPLAEEFAHMLKEIQAGIDRQDAFRHLAQNTEVPEVATFVSSMVQADVFGISVSGVLRTQAREMRVKRRQAAEEQAQKAPVKIVFPLVLCILPVTLIIILGPAVVSIFRAFGM